jgi:uncharacterized membrane protein AbrB (regulator of aidB expression)
VLFVPAALTLNYLVLRRIGGLDRATAYFGGMPGGLLESIELGEQRGADIRALTVLQFARIALVVTTVPLVFAAVEGRAVGSAAGVTLSNGGALAGADALLLIACGAVGYLLGQRLRLPAGHLTGPILVSGIAHARASPPRRRRRRSSPPRSWSSASRWGCASSGMTGAELRRWFGLAALVVAGSLSVGAGFAALCAAAGVAPFEVMALCFAPGGVVEMGLIALSLEASPILVTTHHLARIAARWLRPPRAGWWRRAASGCGVAPHKPFRRCGMSRLRRKDRCRIVVVRLKERSKSRPRRVIFHH